MFESGKPPVVENTEENRSTCRKYCTIRQNYRRHTLEKYQPTDFLRLRDVLGRSMKDMIGSFRRRPLFTRYHLRGGHYCVRSRRFFFERERPRLHCAVTTGDRPSGTGALFYGW